MSYKAMQKELQKNFKKIKKYLTFAKSPNNQKEHI
jgi:hypothetical protein